MASTAIPASEPSWLGPLLAAAYGLHRMDDRIEDVDAPATDLVTPIEELRELRLLVEEPAACPPNQTPVLVVRFERSPLVAEIIEAVRDGWLLCVDALDGAATNGVPTVDDRLLEFARGAEARLRHGEAEGRLTILRLEPTTNAYVSHQSFHEGWHATMEGEDILIVRPYIGS